jgi:hypothetical protein
MSTVCANNNGIFWRQRSPRSLKERKTRNGEPPKSIEQRRKTGIENLSKLEKKYAS